ncbi:hypothetical protein V8C26DRAFT_306096 [Trichoderma gracile]
MGWDEMGQMQQQDRRLLPSHEHDMCQPAGPETPACPVPGLRSARPRKPGCVSASLASFLTLCSPPSALCPLPGRPDAHEPLPPKRPMARHASKCVHTLDHHGAAPVCADRATAASPCCCCLSLETARLGRGVWESKHRPRTSFSVAQVYRIDYGRRRERCCSRSVGPWRKRRAPMPCRAGSMAAASAASLSEAVDLHRRLS